MIGITFTLSGALSQRNWILRLSQALWTVVLYDSFRTGPPFSLCVENDLSLKRVRYPKRNTQPFAVSVYTYEEAVQKRLRLH